MMLKGRPEEARIKGFRLNPYLCLTEWGIPTIYPTTRKTNPAISPDGKRVALGIWRSGAPGGVWLMDADGKNLTQLTNTAVSRVLPGWLSNDEVAYITYRQDEALFTSTNLKTGVERTIISLTPDMDFTRPSPDGKQLAYNSSQSGAIEARNFSTSV
jgi:Tol biopolymer transport system component